MISVSGFVCLLARDRQAGFVTLPLIPLEADWFTLKLNSRTWAHMAYASQTAVRNEPAPKYGRPRSRRLPTSAAACQFLYRETGLSNVKISA